VGIFSQCFCGRDMQLWISQQASLRNEWPPVAMQADHRAREMTGLPASGSALETVKLPLHSSSSDSCRSRSNPGPGMLTVRPQPTRDNAFSADRPALGQRQCVPTLRIAQKGTGSAYSGCRDHGKHKLSVSEGRRQLTISTTYGVI